MEPKELEKPLLVIVGETTSGKTNLAHQLAIRLNGVIINADSTLLRKEFIIGVDKPSDEMRKEVDYKLIDLVSLDEKFTVVDYQRQAFKEINKAYQDKKLPILVGGSGLYLNSVIYNYSFVERRPEDQTSVNIETLDNQDLVEVAKAKELDLAQIDPNNNRRLTSYILNSGKLGKKNNKTNQTYILGIKIDRSQLDANIICRVNQMLKDGLENEVNNLLSEGVKFESLNVIGYKEWTDYFKGIDDLENVKKNIIKNTKILAKKQRTWFKNKMHNDVEWIDYKYNLDEIVDSVTTYFSI